MTKKTASARNRKLVGAYEVSDKRYNRRPWLFQCDMTEVYLCGFERHSSMCHVPAMCPEATAYYGLRKSLWNQLSWRHRIHGIFPTNTAVWTVSQFQGDVKSYQTHALLAVTFVVGIGLFCSLFWLVKQGAHSLLCPANIMFFHQIQSTPFPLGHARNANFIFYKNSKPLPGTGFQHISKVSFFFFFSNSVALSRQRLPCKLVLKMNAFMFWFGPTE